MGGADGRQDDPACRRTGPASVKRCRSSNRRWPGRRPVARVARAGRETPYSFPLFVDTVQWLGRKELGAKRTRTQRPRPSSSGLPAARSAAGRTDDRGRGFRVRSERLERTIEVPEGQIPQALQIGLWCRKGVPMNVHNLYRGVTLLILVPVALSAQVVRDETPLNNWQGSDAFTLNSIGDTNVAGTPPPSSPVPRAVPQFAPDRLWLTITDAGARPPAANGLPTVALSGNARVDALFRRFHVTTFAQVVPFARTASLRDVYEVTCDCDAAQLKTALEGMARHIISKISRVERHQGTVKWFNDAKGFGFISWEGGTDLYVHKSAIIADGLRTLNEGDRVSFEIVEGPKGLMARNVSSMW